jgi:DNA-binding MarR family transcriptional regulator
VNTLPASAPAEDRLGEAELVRLARRISHLRRKRDAVFQPLIFADPEWDILLDLFIEGGFGRKVSMSSLCIAASVPTTTAARCINAMIEQGALLKSRDTNDARRVLIELTDETREKMRVWLTNVSQVWSH